METKDRADFLFRHYDQAVGELNRELAFRARLTLIMLALVVLLLFGASASDVADDLLNHWIQHQTGAARTINLRFVSSVLWFSLSSVMVLYYSRTLVIERQSRYLRRLERRLMDLAGAELVTRYLDARRERTPFLRSATNLYSGMMMLLLFGVMAIVLWAELVTSRGSAWIFTVVDLFIVAFTLRITILFWRSFREETQHPEPEAQAGRPEHP